MGQPTDSELQFQAENILAWDAAFDRASVGIEINGGKVVLMGTVDAHWKLSRAEERIRDLHGVREVENKLTVEPHEKAADVIIALKVGDALERDALIELGKVTVTVLGGIVTLDGRVRSSRARLSAERDASRVFGVIKVDNRLEVSR